MDEMSFSVIYRNIGHWDIYQGGKRICRIRGKKGKYYIVTDNMYINLDNIRFKTVQGAMGYIVDTLMFEEEV